jgi:hypothetical protein
VALDALRFGAQGAMSPSVRAIEARGLVEGLSVAGLMGVPEAD